MKNILNRYIDEADRLFNEIDMRPYELEFRKGYFIETYESESIPYLITTSERKSFGIIDPKELAKLLQELDLDNAAQILSAVDKESYKELSDGVYIASQDEIIADQRDWSDDDEAKDFDFTTNNYWITTNDGDEPLGITNAKELAEFMHDRFY